MLDAGCGFGGTLAHINEHYTGMDLVGLNLDERQLFRAQATVKPQTDNRFNFYKAMPVRCHFKTIFRLMKYYIYAFQKPKQSTVDRTPEMN